MKKIKVSKYGVLLVFILSLFVFVPSVFALGKPDTAGKPSSLPSQLQNRLTQAKLKACQAREAGIQTRFTHLLQLAATMEKNFDAIAGRVEEYYTTKVVPSGKTVANYDTLVADIAASKKTVQTGLDKAKNDISGFSCDGGDPKAQMTAFRLDMQGVIQELKDYRTSIKNLIVAVRSVTGTTESSAKPSPTATP